MTDMELTIMVFRSIQAAMIVYMIFWVSPIFAYEAWLQYEEWRGVRYQERHKRAVDEDDTFFTELVEINRDRPKKTPQHRLEDQKKNG